jgi:hypothetical protein
MGACTDTRSRTLSPADHSALQYSACDSRGSRSAMQAASKNSVPQLVDGKRERGVFLSRRSNIDAREQCRRRHRFGGVVRAKHFTVMTPLAKSRSPMTLRRNHGRRRAGLEKAHCKCSQTAIARTARGHSSSFCETQAQERHASERDERAITPAVRVAKQRFVRELKGGDWQGVCSIFVSSFSERPPHPRTKSLKTPTMPRKRHTRSLNIHDAIAFKTRQSRTRS